MLVLQQLEYDQLYMCCKAFLDVCETTTNSCMSASVQGEGCFRELEECVTL